MSAPARPIVELEGLVRRFGSGESVVEVLQGVDLRVHGGEWLAIVGPSGSGKSTLMNLIGCLDRPTSGTYRLAGVDVQALSDRRRAGLRSRAVGFVFQSFHLLPHRPVIENVMIAEIYRRGPRRDRRDRAASILSRVGLGHRMNTLPTTLSGGERQRVAIARALMNEPLLLLCDEPTGNLDSATTVSVLELFAELHESGQTLLMISHDPDVAGAAQRSVRMIDGKLLDRK